MRRRRERLRPSRPEVRTPSFSSAMTADARRETTNGESCARVENDLVILNWWDRTPSFSPAMRSDLLALMARSWSRGIVAIFHLIMRAFAYRTRSDPTRAMR